MQTQILILVVAIIVGTVAYLMGQRKERSKKAKTTPDPEVDKTAIIAELTRIRSTSRPNAYGLYDADRIYNKIQVEINKTNDAALIKAFTEAVKDIYTMPGTR